MRVMVRCLDCGQPISEKRLEKKARYCSTKCRNNTTLQRYRKLNHRLQLPSSTVGTLAELEVAVDLLRRGYEVFRALSPSCSCDLAVLREGRLLRVEVRTAYYSKAG